MRHNSNIAVKCVSKLLLVTKPTRSIVTGISLLNQFLSSRFYETAEHDNKSSKRNTYFIPKPYYIPCDLNSMHIYCCIIHGGVKDIQLDLFTFEINDLER